MRSQLTRAEAVSGLRRIIVDPASSDDMLQGALRRLERYEALDRADEKRRAKQAARRALRLPTRNLFRRRSGQIAVVLFVANLLLMLSDFRLLVHQRVVPAHETHNGSHLGPFPKEVLFCRYWTGWTLRPVPWWFGFNFERGERDQCPVLFRPPNRSG